MTTLAAIEMRLQRRFKNVEATEIADVAKDTITALGYASVDAVPTSDINRIIAYASYQLATDIAVNSSSYFSYKDGEESVDKTTIAENYRKLAADFKSEYESEELKRNGGGSSFAIAKRVDRD